jgi:hypothetical protein
MGHSFSQWARSFGRDFIAEEDDLGCAENALGRVDNYPELVKSAEENPQMTLVLLA